MEPAVRLVAAGLPATLQRRGQAALGELLGDQRASLAEEVEVARPQQGRALSPIRRPSRTVVLVMRHAHGLRRREPIGVAPAFASAKRSP